MSNTKHIEVCDKKYRNGVVLFRAQPFHNGHIASITKAIEECEEVTILVGSAYKFETERNPFDIYRRLNWVTKYIHSLEFIDIKRVKVYPLGDLSSERDSNYIEWGHYLYYNIVSIIGDRYFSIYYSDNPELLEGWIDDEIDKYIKRVYIDRSTTCNGVSATKIREAVLNDNMDYLLENMPEHMFKHIGFMKGVLMSIQEEQIV